MPKEGKKRKSAEKPVQGLDIFRFWNGDSYIGNYTASSSPSSIYRKGSGKYITDDGNMYSGEWERDKFVQGTIKYTDFTEFRGQLENHKYNNECIYMIPNVGELTSDFKSNIPQGTMKLKDINGKEWSGKQVSSGKTQLFPCNHFKAAFLKGILEHSEKRKSKKSHYSVSLRDSDSKQGSRGTKSSFSPKKLSTVVREN